ncbi:uncharacterized protein LOC144807694 [Lissotriton helveticus]
MKERQEELHRLDDKEAQSKSSRNQAIMVNPTPAVSSDMKEEAQDCAIGHDHEDCETKRSLHIITVMVDTGPAVSSNFKEEAEDCPMLPDNEDCETKRSLNIITVMADIKPTTVPDIKEEQEDCSVDGEDSEVKVSTGDQRGEPSRRAAEGDTGKAPRRERTQEEVLSPAEHTPPSPTPPSPASPLPPPPRASGHTVASLQQMEVSKENSMGGQQATVAEDANSAGTQAPTEHAHTGARRRRARAASPVSQGEDQSVFAGLEGNMLKVQRLQGKAIRSVPRQMVHMNRQMPQIETGISSMNNTAADCVRDMSEAVRLDEDRLARRKWRRKLDNSTKMINRLATATFLLCRRSMAMQEEMAHCSRDMARVLVRMTSALERLQKNQIATTGTGDGGDSEESTSRSSITPPLTKSRRRSERHSAATGQTASEVSVPRELSSAARGRRK